MGVELSDGISAWRRNAIREGWRKLLERAESGESDGIAVWHTDRLFRLPADLVKLLKLSDRGIKLASARGVRDLANPDDVFILHIEVAQAERSSEEAPRLPLVLRSRGFPYLPPVAGYASPSRVLPGQLGEFAAGRVRGKFPASLPLPGGRPALPFYRC